MAILKIPLWLQPQQKASPSAVWGWRDVGHGVRWFQMRCAGSSLADSEAGQQLSPGTGKLQSGGGVGWGERHRGFLGLCGAPVLP